MGHIFVGNFLDFLVKESAFSSFNCTLELFPIFNPFWRPIFFEVSITVSILLTLWMFDNVNNLWTLSLCSFYGVSERLNGMFKGFAIWDTVYVDCSNGFDWLIDKVFLIIAIFDNHMLFSSNIFLKDWNGNCEWSIIENKSPFRVNRVFVKFFWPISKEHQVNNWI